MTVVASINQPGNRSKLAALTVANFPDHHRAFVSTVKDWFRLEKTSAATADGYTVVQSTDGYGKWIRELTAAPEWQLQATWYIDPISGGDENTGIDSSHALKTWAELSRRWGSNPVLSQTTDVIFLNNLADTDVINLDIILNASHASGGNQPHLRFSGQQTQLATGTVTAYSAANGNINQANQVTATLSSGSWTTYINKMCIMTSGANVGAIFWVAKDLGAGQARISQPGTVLDTYTPNGNITQVSLNNGETFKIVDITKIPFVYITIHQLGNNVVGYSRFIWRDLASNGTGSSTFNNIYGNTIKINNGVKFYAIRCWLNEMSTRQGQWQIQASLDTTNTIGYPQDDSYMVHLASGCLFAAPTALIVRCDGVFSLSEHCLFQSSGIIIAGTNNHATMGFSPVGIFDVTGDALTISEIGVVKIFGPGVNAGQPGIYGNGNTGYGVKILGNGKLLVGTTGFIPTINSGLGLGKEIRVGGIDRLWSEVPVVDDNTNAAITWVQS